MRKLSQAILFVSVMCVNCNLPGADIIALDFNRAYGVSSDGKKIAGYTSLEKEGYSLTVGANRVLLSKPNWANVTRPTDISSDGSTIVGWVSSISQNVLYRAARWTQNGITDLGVVNPGDYSVATGVSSDGGVIVGYSTNDAANRDSAFRWTQATGMVKIASGSAEDVSGDGSIVVGFDSTLHAFRWTAVTGAVNFLGDSGPMNLFTESEAHGISTNGKYIVGRYQAQRAFIWSETDGIKDLGFGFSGGDADVTNDGKVAVFSGGIFWNGFTNSAVALKSYLTDSKATGIGDWSSINYISAITGDNVSGYNIVGYGNVSGVGQRGFLVRGITFPVPEPSSYLLAVIATSVIVVLVRERKLVNLRSI
jgi:probable HAF family extracellular repeat protein